MARKMKVRDYVGRRVRLRAPFETRGGASYAVGEEFVVNGIGWAWRLNLCRDNHRVLIRNIHRDSVEVLLEVTA